MREEDEKDEEDIIRLNAFIRAMLASEKLSFPEISQKASQSDFIHFTGYKCEFFRLTSFPQRN